MVEMMSKLRHSVRQLEDELGRLPSTEELSVHMGVSTKKLKIIRKAVKAYNSPTQSGGGEGEMTIDEMVPDSHNAPPDEVVRSADEIRQMVGLLGQIDERAATILRLRYGLGGEDPLTLKQIGLRIGLTRERVRQIEHETLKRLRDNMGEKEQAAPIRRRRTG